MRSPALRGLTLKRSLRLCLVAPSERLIGGHAVQASELRRGLEAVRAVRVTFVASDSPFPAWLRVLGGVLETYTLAAMVAVYLIAGLIGQLFVKR